MATTVGVGDLSLKDCEYKFLYSVDRSGEVPRHDISVFDMSFLEGRKSNGLLTGLTTGDLIRLHDWLGCILKRENAIEELSQFPLPTF